MSNDVWRWVWFAVLVCALKVTLNIFFPRTTVLDRAFRYTLGRTDVDAFAQMHNFARGVVVDAVLRRYESGTLTLYPKRGVRLGACDVAAVFRHDPDAFEFEPLMIEALETPRRFLCT